VVVELDVLVEKIEVVVEDVAGIVVVSVVEVVLFISIPYGSGCRFLAMAFAMGLDMTIVASGKKATSQNQKS